MPRRAIAPQHLASLALAAALLAGCDGTPRPEPQTPSSAGSSSPDAGGTPTTAATGAASGVPAAPPSPGEAAAFARASNSFGLDLFGRLRRQPGNFTYSPASISLALAMTWGGAVGPTSDEMRRVLRFEGSPRDVMASAGKLSAALQDPERPVVLAIANRLFGEKTYTFERAYLDDTATFFGAPLEPVDFRNAPEAARGRINGWVAERTKDRIRDLVPPRGVGADTRLGLVNAVYFLGDWAIPFGKEATAELPFLVDGKTAAKVPTMRKVETFAVADADDATLVELPYRGGGLSMVIVVPSKPDGIGELEAKVDPARWTAWTAALARERVNLQLPKFEVNPAGSLALRPMLDDMGMKLAFDRERADFTRIANPPSAADRLVVSDVFHKAFVKVDEKGTEAAAATAVMMSRAGSAAPPKPPREIRVDRPFLFFLRDVPSNLILFAGRVVDPTKT